jgi:hypothetical protein
MGEPEDLVPFVTSRSLEFGIGVASAGDAARDGSISTRCAPSEGGWPPALHADDGSALLEA